jgi:uncharacterized protein (DUF1499 family)
MALFSCAGTRPDNLGIKESKLAACPSTPNCVSSDAADEHAVAPFALAQPAGDAWRAARSAVAALPRTTIIALTDDYLRAECRSLVFGFVDDLELHLRPAENAIAVRSASRLGRSDLGVNRRRVERLRRSLQENGVVR